MNNIEAAVKEFKKGSELSSHLEFRDYDYKIATLAMQKAIFLLLLDLAQNKGISQRPGSMMKPQDPYNILSGIFNIPEEK